MMLAELVVTVLTVLGYIYLGSIALTFIGMQLEAIWETFFGK